MNKRVQTVAAMIVFAISFAIAPGSAQTSGDSKMASMPDKMGADKMMTKEQKAAMFDKMTDANKMAAEKMSGHDMSKMSSQDRMAMTDKMSTDDKAMMYDKFAASAAGKKATAAGKMGGDKMDDSKMGDSKMK